MTSDDASVIERVLPRLPPGATVTSSSDVDERFEISTDADRLDAELDALESDLHFAVALHARDAVFVHAGVVGWQGRALVVPGRSMSGKSSLVVALVRAGASYYSDEYAVIDDAGLVHAYPKRPRPRASKASDELGTDLDGRDPLPIGLVIVTRYEAGARWRPRPISRAEAMLALLDNTVTVRRQPARTLSTMEVATRGADAVESVRGEGEVVAGALVR